MSGHLQSEQYRSMRVERSIKNDNIWELCLDQSFEVGC